MRRRRLGTNLIEEKRKRIGSVTIATRIAILVRLVSNYTFIQNDFTNSSKRRLEKAQAHMII